MHIPSIDMKIRYNNKLISSALLTIFPGLAIDSML
jgi:hypothetical protein